MIINYRLLQTIILKFLTILGGGAFNIPTVEAVAYSLYDLSAKTVDKLILSKNLYVSDSYGNDIIAIKGNPHRSYKTIEAAVSASTVGILKASPIIVRNFSIIVCNSRYFIIVNI